MKNRRLIDCMGLKKDVMRMLERRLASHFERPRRGPPFRHCVGFDHSAFSFDPSEDIVNRTAQALAVSLLKFSALRPDKMTDVDAGWLAGVGELIQTHNPVLGREVDYARALPSLVETFLRLSPGKFGGIAQVQNAQIRKTLPQVVEMLDDLPISVQGFGLTGPSVAP